MTEIKQVGMLLLLVLPLFAGAFLFSYANIRNAQREAARNYLIKTYSLTDAHERETMIRNYGFTDDEINPSKLLGDLLEAK